MKYNCIILVFFFCLFICPNSVFAISEEDNNNQAATQLKLELRRKILPNVLPGNSASVMDKKVGFKKTSSSYIVLDSEEKALPKMGAIHGSWLYSGMGIVISSVSLLILRKNKRDKKGVNE